MSEIIENNDPNNKWGKHTVELVLKSWDYHATFNIDVGGNCRGLDVMETAIGNLYDKLEGMGPLGGLINGDAAYVVLVNKDGGDLLCVDDDDRGDDWLKDLVVSARIIAYTPPAKKADDDGAMPAAR